MKFVRPILLTVVGTVLGAIVLNELQRREIIKRLA